MARRHHHLLFFKIENAQKRWLERDEGTKGRTGGRLGPVFLCLWESRFSVCSVIGLLLTGIWNGILGI